MQEKYPLLGDRIQSTFIDTILIILLIFLFAAVLDRFEQVPDWVRIVLFLVVFIMYEPISMTFGATLGNYIKGIRVRKQGDISKRVNFFQAILRYPVKVLLGWISFLTIHSNPEKRAIHDLISGSVVINVSGVHT